MFYILNTHIHWWYTISTLLHDVVHHSKNQTLYTTIVQLLLLSVARFRYLESRKITNNILPYLNQVNMKQVVYCFIFLALAAQIRCSKKPYQDNKPLILLESKSKNLSHNRHTRTLAYTYGVLTNDQRFENTDIIQLNSGALMAILGNTFENSSKTSVFKCYSYDNGRTWTSPQNINLPYTGCDFTHCNLFKVNARIYLVLNRVANARRTLEGGIPAISFSDDEGVTWSRPQLMLHGREREIVIINARNITITKTGRIIIPITYGQFGTNPYHINMLYSDNNARTWKESSNSFAGINTAEAKFAEPTVAELKDGRLIMLLRTNLGHIYKSYSSDNGITWSMPECTTLVSPWTAHSIRVTKHGYIVVVYTNSISTNDPGYPRNNLKCAVSYDNGETWKQNGTIIEIPESLTEFVMEPNITLLQNGKCIVSYYHQLNTNYHRVETAHFDTQTLLRDEENWENLQWWSISGHGKILAVNNILELGSSNNFTLTMQRSMLIANSYSLEFIAKISSFIKANLTNEYATLGLKVEDGMYKFIFRVETDGLYVMDHTNVLIKHTNTTYQKYKDNWNLWRITVKNGKAEIFMNEISITGQVTLPKSMFDIGNITLWTNSSPLANTHTYIKHIYYDPF